MHTGLHYAENRKKRGVADPLDRAMIFVGLVSPVALLPQVVTIWINKDVSSISVISWILLAGVSGAWVVYGIVRRSNALVISNALLVILDALVAVAWFLFR